MAPRKKAKQDVETEVLLSCARRCALCYYLNNDLREKVGQVAHIDQDPSHSTEDNLIFLCMEHHTLYDSKTSQHKNYTAGELCEMKAVLLGTIAAKEHFKQPQAPKIIRRKKPKLNVVYTIGQAAWSIGGQMQPSGKMKKLMQISFWATFTTDGDEPVLILEAYPEGTDPIEQSQERDSVLSALGRIGKASLKQKVRHRAQLVANSLPQKLPEITTILDTAVDFRNHLVHGSPIKLPSQSLDSIMYLLTDTLEFIFAASDLVESGWEITEWDSRTSTSHPFGRYLKTYIGILAHFKSVLRSASGSA